MMENGRLLSYVVSLDASATFLRLARGVRAAAGNELQVESK